MWCTSIYLIDCDTSVPPADCAEEGVSDGDTSSSACYGKVEFCK